MASSAAAAPVDAGIADRRAELPGPEQLESLPIADQQAIPRGVAVGEAAATPARDEGGSSVLADLAAERAGYAGDPEPPAAKTGSEERPPGANPIDSQIETPTETATTKPRWIRHEVVAGERLDEIAGRYGVRKTSLVRWNKLDEDKPTIRAGQTLKVYAQVVPPPRQKIIYAVRYGDTWAKIAAAHGVDPEHLRKRWNRDVPRRFKVGEKLTIWVEPVPEEEQEVVDAGGIPVRAGKTRGKTGPPLALEDVRRGAISVGKPNRGRLRNAVQIPSHSALYTVRKPEESWGSTHAIRQLQHGIAVWRRDSGYDGALIIGAISRKSGGRLRPHSSHQSGRDVDIRLPLVRGGGKDATAASVADVDWDATWKLVKAFVDDGEVDYIFLEHGRQKALYRAAKRAGASDEELERMIQYPREARTNHGVVRHAKGHTSHMHVRFSCADYELACESY